MPKRLPAYTHWTADTELAFLLALRLTGKPTEAAVEIGRHIAGAYKRRERLPEFAARWEAEVERWQERNAAEVRAAAPDPGVMPNRVRFDGFTPVRQRAFLRALSETGSLKSACKRIGVSKEAALRMRRTYPSFAAAWDRAETHCEADLEQIAIERAIDGVTELVSVGGQMVPRTRYPEQTMTKLLDIRERRTRDEKADEANAAKNGSGRRVRSKEDVIAVIMKRLDAIDAHEKRKKAAADARMWAAWQATWGNFGRGGLHLGAVEQEVLPPLSPAEEAKAEPLRWV